MNNDEALKKVDTWLSEQGKLEASHGSEKPVITPEIRRAIDRVMAIALDKIDPMEMGDVVEAADGMHFVARLEPYAAEQVDILKRATET